MADENVRNAQRWVNETYRDVRGYREAPENGRTGWPTLYSLTRALQHELGITELSDAFGPETLKRLTERWPVIDGGNGPENVVRIVQAALYCKGYPGDDLSGVYDGQTSASVTTLKDEMGVAEVLRGDAVVPKVFKALLTMDAYRRTDPGTDSVRAVQRWLNGTYVERRDFFVVPCDGRPSREVSKALIMGVQFELGMDDDTANGRFGPSTRQGVKDQAQLEIGDSDSSRRFVRLFQGAMRCNGREVSFDGRYTAQVAGAVGRFQEFAGLEPVNGDGDFQTWASLLVSTGDTARKGRACDCVTEITPARGDALKRAGYRVVGRYLSNSPHSDLDKRIQRGELKRILAAGLTVFPIYETDGDGRAYFTEAQGRSDALLALDAARAHGFKRDTTLYFAVDFDAVGEDVSSRVIPYFEALVRRMGFYGSPYGIGVYGARDVCTRLANEGLTDASFVADMSPGWSGNAGFPLPKDWTFDQISTVTVGENSGRVEIDNDIASGRDDGQSEFTPPPAGSPPLDVAFDRGQRDDLLADVRTYLESLGVRDIPGRYLNFTKHSLDRTLEFDGLITGLARAFRMRKSIIQCPIFWEIRKLTPMDTAADGFVLSYYSWKTQVEAWEKMPLWQRLITPYPEYPVGAKDDASTGLGQIFAATAIRARNFAVETDLIKGRKYNAEDWHDMWAVWEKLHEDHEYNVATVPLVLIQGADEIGVDTDRLEYSEADTRRVLARYNGTGDSAEEYGRQLLGLYKVFEKYNAPARS